MGRKFGDNSIVSFKQNKDLFTLLFKTATSFGAFQHFLCDMTEEVDP